MTQVPGEIIRTADGMPLGLSLQRTLLRSRLRALLLVLPLLAFLTVTFVLPILDMLYRSVDNRIVASILPHTTVAIQTWDSKSTELPGEPVFEALVLDIQAAYEQKTLGRVGRRLNYEKPGMSSLFRNQAAVSSASLRRHSKSSFWRSTSAGTTSVSGD